MKKRMDERGISPLIATVMLVSISVAAAGTVYIWLQGFIGEQTDKGGAPIERSCDQLKFTAEISNDNNEKTLIINNGGNIPIKQLYIKAFNPDGSTIIYEKSPARDSDSHIPAIFTGSVVKILIKDIYDSQATKMEVIPVLYGTGTKSKQPKIGFCPDQKIELEMP